MEKQLLETLKPGVTFPLTGLQLLGQSFTSTFKPLHKETDLKRKARHLTND